jgi:hypothetical protein
MTGEIKAPQRAITLTLRIGADDRRSLAHQLYHMAHQVEAEQLTVGQFGSPTSGGEYELVEIDKPHEKYFEELHAYLTERRAKTEPHAESDVSK